MTIARILATKGRHVSTTQAHRTLSEALALLAAHNIGALVVSDSQGAVLGILSERDIVRSHRQGWRQRAGRRCFKAYDCKGRRSLAKANASAQQWRK